MARRDPPSVLLVPLVTWAGLLVALAATVSYAFLPNAPIKPWVGLSIAAIKAVLIGLFFMRLTRAAGLVRVTAVVGLLWLSLLFVLGFCDFLTRLAPPH
jgi:cytochrome c oxidase subunit 4